MLALAAVLLLAPTVRADTVSFNITAGNAAVSPYPSPYASVLINEIDRTHATITVTGVAIT